jgi:hypothetical protein
LAQGYYWVVTCKNIGFHTTQNLFHGHIVPLGRTDAYSARPKILEPLEIACNDSECGRTYSYAPSEVIRWFGDASLVTSHPLF